MTPEQFAYWLQGFAELNGQQPTESQWESIKEHSITVFSKVTSSHTINVSNFELIDEKPIGGYDALVALVSVS